MTIAERLKQEGRAEGYAEGKQLAQKGIVQVLLRKGMSPEFVMKITGLTKPELKKLRR